MRQSTARIAKPAATDFAISPRQVTKVHGRGDGAVVALDGVSAAFAVGSFTAIMGPSGSGKSTFLNVAAGLDRPTSGTVALGDTELARLSERRLTMLRRERIGFVFQAFNLLPSLTVAHWPGRSTRPVPTRSPRSSPTWGTEHAASRHPHRLRAPRHVHRRPDRSTRGVARRSA